MPSVGSYGINELYASVYLRLREARRFGPVPRSVLDAIEKDLETLESVLRAHLKAKSHGEN